MPYMPAEIIYLDLERAKRRRLISPATYQTLLKLLRDVMKGA